MYNDTPEVYGVIPERIKGTQLEYLVVLGRKAEKWSFPKGHPNENESARECAIREAKEETGLDFNIDNSIPIRLATGIYYKVRVQDDVNPIPIDNREIMDCRWMSMEELHKSRRNIDLSVFLRIYYYTKPRRKHYDIYAKRCFH